MGPVVRYPTDPHLVHRATVGRSLIALVAGVAYLAQAALFAWAAQSADSAGWSFGVLGGLVLLLALSAFALAGVNARASRAGIDRPRLAVLRGQARQISAFCGAAFAVTALALILVPLTVSGADAASALLLAIAALFEVGAAVLLAGLTVGGIRRAME